jgi:capping protein beta
MIVDKLALPSDAEHTGSWDSLHVFECQERGRSAKYKLTSTVMLVLKSKTAAQAEKVDGKGSGDVALSGSMTRQVRLEHQRCCSGYRH